MSIEIYLNVLKVIDEYGYLEETNKIKSTLIHILNKLEEKGFVKRCFHYKCINGRALNSFRWELTNLGKNYLSVLNNLDSEFLRKLEAILF